MNITLYTTNDDRRKLVKTKSVITSLSCEVKDKNDMLSPVAIVNYNEDILNCNYAYIEEFDRYYFVYITSLNGGRFMLEMNEDVLSSLADKIINIPVLLDKTELLANSNKYFNDGSYIATQKEFIRLYEFANGFNETGTYILIACGG